MAAFKLIFHCVSISLTVLSFMLIALSFVNGAVLANQLVLLLFFWEGLMISLFALIMTGGKESFTTAVKTFVLVGVSDLLLMLGIGILGYLNGNNLKMSEIHHLPLDNGLAIFAFFLLVIGAISKAGAVPFHSWIPDAAKNAPLPFMAFLPASLEKLLGIYLMVRINLDFFDVKSGSVVSIILMSIGALTILVGSCMSLVQKDYKKLLSYCAISQVGYIILGFGSAVPVGIVGGIFHMLNHSMYKSCLFLTGGSVERQAGSTSLASLGGLGEKMPITFICFLITALSVSGVPPFNGFFSKELIFDGALECGGYLFYAIAIIGAFFTTASFIRLGHAVFIGKPKDEYWLSLTILSVI